MSEHDGHRQRLLKKIETEELSAHEYLEALLFPIIPRINVNPLAHRLLARFGTVRGVFNASIKQLEEIEGVGHGTAVFLYGAGKLFSMLGHGPTFFPQCYDRASFLAFVKQEYEYISCEVLDVFFIDENSSIVGRKRFTVDNVSTVRFKVDELAEYVCVNRPAGMAIVHNHPSGTARPSIKDNVSTAKCLEICHLYDALLCDHVIYSSSGAFSYHESGSVRDEPIEGAGKRLWDLLNEKEKRAKEKANENG